MMDFNTIGQGAQNPTCRMIRIALGRQQVEPGVSLNDSLMPVVTTKYGARTEHGGLL